MNASVNHIVRYLSDTRTAACTLIGRALLARVGGCMRPRRLVFTHAARCRQIHMYMGGRGTQSSMAAIKQAEGEDGGAPRISPRQRWGGTRACAPPSAPPGTFGCSTGVDREGQGGALQQNKQSLCVASATCGQHEHTHPQLPSPTHPTNAMGAAFGKLQA